MNLDSSMDSIRAWLGVIETYSCICSFHGESYKLNAGRETFWSLTNQVVYRQEVNPGQVPPSSWARSQGQNWGSNPLLQTLPSGLLFPHHVDLTSTGTGEALCYSHQMRPFQGNFFQLPVEGQGSSLPLYRNREMCSRLELRLRFPIINNAKQDCTSTPVMASGDVSVNQKECNVTVFKMSFQF